MNRSPIAGLVAAAVLLASISATHADPGAYHSPATATWLSLGGVIVPASRSPALVVSGRL